MNAALAWHLTPWRGGGASTRKRQGKGAGAMAWFEGWNVERHLRTVHGWLGALILPWVILAGLTGLYLNHRDAVEDWLPVTLEAEMAGMDHAPGIAPVTAEGAFALAARVHPGTEASLKRDATWRNRAVWWIDTAEGDVIVDRDTGHVWLEESYLITMLAPDGAEMGHEVRWSRVVSSLHERGWLGTGLGRWLADTTAVALVVFGVTGIVLFLSPRLRRRRNRRARQG
jgi:hypothetical protein